MCLHHQGVEAFRQADIVQRRATPEAGPQTALLLQLFMPLAQSGLMFITYNIHCAASCFLALAAFALCFSADVAKYFTRGHAARQVVVFIGIGKDTIVKAATNE
jgi:hypothetical protein